MYAVPILPAFAFAGLSFGAALGVRVGDHRGVAPAGREHPPTVLGVGQGVGQRESRPADRSGGD